jgi:phosphoribosyl 1,2-cyclic phosphate phosphodiesterase
VIATLIGTGTSQGVPVIACGCVVCTSANPHDKRLRSAVFIQDEGINVVIDTGPDFRQQMLTLKPSRLDAVLLTHAHKDHIAGLDEVRSFNFAQGNEQIPVYAQDIVIDRLKIEFAYCFEEIKYPGVPNIRAEEVSKNYDFNVGSLVFTPIEVMHYKLPVLGFRYKDFTYITDAKTISDEEKAKIEGSEVLILNGLQWKEHISHFTVPEAIEFINSLDPLPRITYLTHISHTLGLHDEVNAMLPEHIKLAYDGLQIVL